MSPNYGFKENLKILEEPNSFPGDHSERVPPDSISNSVVKLLSADDSVGSPHVKVGHCQGFITGAEVIQLRLKGCHTTSLFFCEKIRNIF